jgi:hypothetical protein
LNALWSWFSSNKWAMFVFFLAIGGFVCFLGRKLFRPVLFIVGMLLTVSIVLLLFYSTFLASTTKVWVGWLVLVGSILLGLVVGTIFTKLVKLGAFALAGWGGFSGALLIYNAFLYHMNSQAGFWCFTVGVGVICGILAMFFFEHILIHSTAMAGAYLFVQGIGLVAGRYQNPFTIAEEREQGVITTIDPVFYGYLAGTIALYALGAFVQYRHRTHHKSIGHDPYHRLR